MTRLTQQDDANIRLPHSCLTFTSRMIERICMIRLSFGELVGLFYCDTCVECAGCASLPYQFKRYDSTHQIRTNSLQEREALDTWQGYFWLEHCLSTWFSSESVGLVLGQKCETKRWHFGAFSKESRVEHRHLIQYISIRSIIPTEMSLFGKTFLLVTTEIETEIEQPQSPSGISK